MVEGEVDKVGTGAQLQERGADADRVVARGLLVERGMEVGELLVE